MIPITIPPLRVHLHADRRLMYQVVTAFGGPSFEEGASSKVLDRDGDRLLVQFDTPARDFLGRRNIYRTVEWVSAREPDLIEFHGVDGPLAMLHDRFVLAEAVNCTNLIYESEFGVRGGIFGWLFGRTVVIRLMRRMMREHMAELKRSVENRSERSRVYPHPVCDDPVTGYSVLGVGCWT